MTFAFFNVLEPRTLLSSTHEEPHPAPVVPNPTSLDADRAAVTADLAKMKSDYAAGMAELAAARQMRQTHAAVNAATMKSLSVKANKDEKAATNLHVAFESQVKVNRTKWSAVIGPEERDVQTNSEGESEQERHADTAKLALDRGAAAAEYNALLAITKSAQTDLESEVKSNRAALEAAKKTIAAQVKADASAVSIAEVSVKSVFNSDKLVVDADLKVYRSHGGNVDALKLLYPKLGTSERK